MFIDNYPKFTAGRVLKHEMLNLLRDYPRGYIDILYSDYVDGVIAGCSISVNPDALSIAPGIVRYQGKLLTLVQSENISYTATGQETIVKIRFSKEKDSLDYTTISGEIVSDLSPKIADNEMELCRYKLKAGARLRDDYQNFGDMATDYDTLNIICMPYATHYETTLSPIITRKFAEEALQNKMIHPFDYMFIGQCVQGEPVARTLITAYTSARLNIKSKDSTNLDLHRQLTKILNDIRQGKDIASHLGRSGGRRILVD